MISIFAAPIPVARTLPNSIKFFSSLSFRKANAYSITAFIMVDYTIPNLLSILFLTINFLEKIFLIKDFRQQSHKLRWLILKKTNI